MHTPAALASSAGASHAAFLLIRPRIEAHGRVVFRNVRCRHRREEMIAEMVGLCWLWCLRLVEQGKDPLQFPSALATFAARQVRSGRRLTGVEKSKDVMSAVAQRRRGFAVRSLPGGSALLGNAFDEALQDNAQTPVPDQVSFRLDFPSWVASRTERDRRVIGDLMLGERTLDVAHRHGLSPGRISQLRREFMEDWRRFGEDDDGQPFPRT